MRKYLQLVKVNFQEYFVYRLNFVLWRFRSLLFFLTLLFFWQAVYTGKDALLGYQKSQMMAYVVGIAFIRSFVLGTRTADMGAQIRNGDLVKIIILPLKMVKYWFTRDMVDKILNFAFSVLEIGLVVWLLKIPFYSPQQATTYLWFGLVMFLAILLFFFISYFLAVTAFWTQDVWATRWLFGAIILNFFAGSVFPIDVMPAWFSRVAYLTPFPYLVFFPIKVWLEQLPADIIFRSVLICSAWLGFFYWASYSLWKKGVKNFGAYGG